MDRIEKVSRYIPAVSPTRGTGGEASDNGSTVRHMLLSIPRVKFLEGGETEHYHKYKVLENEPVIISPSYSDRWCELVKAEPPTERELLVEKMVNDGASRNAIADHLHMARGTIANLLSRIRVKRAYQALKGCLLIGAAISVWDGPNGPYAVELSYPNENFYYTPQGMISAPKVGNVTVYNGPNGEYFGSRIEGDMGGLRDAE